MLNKTKVIDRLKLLKKFSLLSDSVLTEIIDFTISEFFENEEPCEYNLVKYIEYHIEYCEEGFKFVPDEVQQILYNGKILWSYQG